VRSIRWTAAAGIATAFILATATPAAAQAQPAATVVTMTPELAARIQTMVDDFSSAHAKGDPSNDSAVSVAVVTSDPSGGQVTTTFTTGLANRASAITADASTQFELGSETKVFTADLLAYLVATDRVTLDERIGDLAPDWVPTSEPAPGDAPGWQDITLGQLATHTSGLPDLATSVPSGCTASKVGGVWTYPCEGYTPEDLWTDVQGVTLLSPPGTEYVYSDWGFGLLGTILSGVLHGTTKTAPPAFQQSLDEAFLTELGMSATEVEPTEGLIDDTGLAVPYADGVRAQFWHNSNALVGGGGLLSNAEDMGTWVAAHLGYVPAAPGAGVTAMADTLDPLVPLCPTSTDPPNHASVCTEGQDPTYWMGLGWRLNPAGTSGIGVDWAVKNGDTTGSSSDTVLAPELGVAVTTMFNRARLDGEQVAEPILHLLVDSRNEPAPTPAPTGAPAAALAATGSDPWSAVALAASAGALALVGGLLTRRRALGGRGR
jgi:CubicO group peptidase (beta-lactamase class C family)